MVERLRTRLPEVVAGGGLTLLAILALPYAVDDAFIVFRYADNLAAGAGWTFNAGAPPSDGVTGPLWVVPAWLAVVTGLSPVWVARGVGLAGGVIAALLVVRRLRGRCGGRRGSWAAAALLALMPQLAIWCIAGLSTGAAAALATGAALAATARPHPRPFVLGGCIAALAWLRPELAPFASVLLGGAALRGRRVGMRAFAVAACGAASVLAFRLYLFGDPLPLSFYAKPADVPFGVGYAVRGAMVLTGIGGIGLVALSSLIGRRDDRLLGVALLVHLAAIAVAGGDWMPGFRLHAPVLPIYAWVAGALFTRPPPRIVAPKVLGVALLVMALVVPGLDAWVQVPRASDAGLVRRTDGGRVAETLRAHGDSVALVDIGYLGYLSGLRVVDLGGVTDEVIAHASGGHADKEIDLGYLDSRAPELVVLNSRDEPVIDDDGRVHLRGALPVEHRLARSGWLTRGYTLLRVMPYGEGYYVLFGRSRR